MAKRKSETAANVGELWRMADASVRRVALPAQDKHPRQVSYRGSKLRAMNADDVRVALRW